MGSLRGLLAVTATLFLVSQSPGITIRFPSDSLIFGSKFTDQTVQILIDSVSTSDSLIGITFSLRCDTNKLRAIGIGKTGTISDGSQINDAEGRYDRGGYVVHVMTNGRDLIVGSGALITVVFQVLDDSAGVVPVSFDSLYTEIDIRKASGIGGVSQVVGTTVAGNFVFSPTADIRVDSTEITFTKDTFVSVPVYLNLVRGDGVKSMKVRFRSGSSNIVFAQVDTVGSLLGKYASTGGWWQDSLSDSGRTVTIEARRDTGPVKWEDSVLMLRLNYLVRGTASVTSTLFIDSLVLNGIVEPFKVSTHGGKFVAHYVPAVGVAERRMDVSQQATVFPNPANAIVTVKVPSRGGINKLEIFDDAGRIVLENSVLNGEQMTVATTELRTGIYLVRLRMETNSATASFLVKH